MTVEASSRPTPPARAAAAAIAGVVAGVFVVVLYSRQAAGVVSDWDATGTGARALLEGKSPYAAGQMPPWPWRINYPIPAILLSTPFALLPLWLARGAFVGVATTAEGACTLTETLLPEG